MAYKPFEFTLYNELTGLDFVDAVVTAVFGLQPADAPKLVRGPPPVEAPKEARGIDARLLGGSALFGIGWGIAGFCPGGALPALGTGRVEVILFVAALIAGILAARWLLTTGARRLGMVRGGW